MSQFHQPAYHVPRTSGVCCATGRELQPGETIFACLVELTDHEHDTLREQRPNDPALALGLRRVDVAAEAWESGRRPARLFSFWKTTVPEPNEKKKLFIDDATLLQLLTRLEDAQAPDRLAFRFVLALILLRKKLLRYDRVEKRTVAPPGSAPPGSESSEDEAVERSFWILTPKLDPAKGPLGKWDESRRLEVMDPQLGDDEIASVTEQLHEILAAEL